MKKVLICGWYGTETIGDRAILVGILKVLNEVIKDCRVTIASLYPFFTARTLIEDADFFKIVAPNISIDCFDVQDVSETNKQVLDSDLVIMGGGPIMNLFELEIVYYIFAKAKQENKKTMLMGCGMGPLSGRQFIKLAKRVVSLADISVFRDKRSLNYAQKMFNNRSDNLFAAHDPAIIAVGEFLKISNVNKDNSIAINMRDFMNSGFQVDACMKDDILAKLIDDVAQCSEHVKLIPMHTFSIGGDDRLYLSKLKNMTKSGNITVSHQPMSTWQTFEQFAVSKACVGMRYHSVVFQTLLNGNNYILDYTDNNNGKIASFLKDIDKQLFYKNRRLNILNSSDSDLSGSVVDSICKNQFFEYNKTIFNATVMQYSKLVSTLI